MEVATQFSVFLVNKPVLLANICQALAQAKINVRAMTMMDSVEHGVLRVVPADADRARQVLRKLGLTVQETPVLCVTLANRPGAMADVLIRLASEHVNLSYAYVTGGATGGKTVSVLKVDNIKKAQKALEGRRMGSRDMNNKLRRPAVLR